jgi:hypothetical protein
VTLTCVHNRGVGKMRKLTDDVKYPLDTFKRCQLCGFSKNDICEFIMWWECDESDKFDENSDILITCKSKSCQKIIDKHERLYQEVTWSRGGPGKFMIFCGDCANRSGSKCIHPKLKANGGDGLKVMFNIAFKGMILCSKDKCFQFPHPATECEGLVKREQST